jgi:hypothetical protein
MLMPSRRSVILGLSIAGLSGPTLLRAASPVIVVYKDPNCGCCSGWVEHIREAGFQARVSETADLSPIKARLLVPRALASCHTAEIEGYVIEGHVPAAAIRRLLAERPAATGLAVPGMPVGSPGMEVPGSPDETYDVFVFDPSSRKVFASFKGKQEARRGH